MTANNNLTPIISTIKEKCKTCYTCVRECPAKAIVIENGQAEVIEERCIHCGNCVKVCSQEAKKVQSSVDKVMEVISSENKTAAILAPSFPAEFNDLDLNQFVVILRKLGFNYVHEVGFGADLVAQSYKQLLDNSNGKSYIATTCPAIVSYIEKYHPQLVDNLAPIVSPMIATSRVLKKLYGPEIRIVFIGPCIAKKSEKERIGLKGEIDAVITFKELRILMNEISSDSDQSQYSLFNPPYSKEGALFSISGGFVQAANLDEDLIQENIITANGKTNFCEAIKEFGKGYLNTKILETLSCEGCILGPGFSNNTTLYERRHLVSKYVREKLSKQDNIQWQKDINSFRGMDLSCKFNQDNKQIELPNETLIVKALKSLGKNTIKDELNCGACGYETCRDHAIAILRGFAENEMCLPYTIDKLRQTVTDLEKSYIEIKNIRETLNHREKLASMGQLSAGITHELNNPLGVILMYSHILSENTSIPDDVREDIEVIVNHSNRCKKIVSGLLNFSRQNKLIKTQTNLVELCKYCLDSIHIPHNIHINIVSEHSEILAEFDKDQISQVIINLVNNSIDAIADNSGLINIILSATEHAIEFIVQDTGPGIPDKYIKQVFDPFFTTKQIGKGTGLGLSVSYGIVKMHSGSIEIQSNSLNNNNPNGTSVKVTIPTSDVITKDKGEIQ